MKTGKIIIAFFTITAAMVLLCSCSGESTKAIRIGDTIASFTATDLEGRSYSLASHKGKPVIIRFFLLNCPYCKADTPIFNEFYNKFRQKGLETVYINNNGIHATEVQIFRSDLKIKFPVILILKEK